MQEIVVHLAESRANELSRSAGTDVAASAHVPDAPPPPPPPPSLMVAGPGMAAELRTALLEVWQWRELLRQLTLRDLRVRYKQAVFGVLWALLVPALVVLAGVLVRLAVARATGLSLDLSGVGAVAVKALPWAFFAGALGAATPSLTNNAHLFGKVYFPRQVLPLGAVMAHVVDVAIGAAVLAVALPWLGARLTSALLWLPVLVALLVLLTVGIALAASAANLFFRDVKYVVQVMLTFGIFFTPIVFEPAAFGETVRLLLGLNPLTPVVEGARLVIIEGHDLARTIPSEGIPLWSPWYLVYTGVWAAAAFTMSLIAFRRLQPLFAERA